MGCTESAPAGGGNKSAQPPKHRNGDAKRVTTVVDASPTSNNNNDTNTNNHTSAAAGTNGRGRGGGTATKAVAPEEMEEKRAHNNGSPSSVQTGETPTTAQAASPAASAAAAATVPSTLAQKSKQASSEHDPEPEAELARKQTEPLSNLSFMTGRERAGSGGAASAHNPNSSAGTPTAGPSPREPAVAEASTPTLRAISPKGSLRRNLSMLSNGSGYGQCSLVLIPGEGRSMSIRRVRPDGGGQLSTSPKAASHNGQIEGIDVLSQGSESGSDTEDEPKRRWASAGAESPQQRGMSMHALQRHQSTKLNMSFSYGSPQGGAKPQAPPLAANVQEIVVDKSIVERLNSSDAHQLSPDAHPSSPPAAFDGAPGLELAIPTFSIPDAAGTPPKVFRRDSTPAAGAAAASSPPPPPMVEGVQNMLSECGSSQASQDDELRDQLTAQGGGRPFHPSFIRSAVSINAPSLSASQNLGAPPAGQMLDVGPLLLDVPMTNSVVVRDEKAPVSPSSSPMLRPDAGASSLRRLPTMSYKTEHIGRIGSTAFELKITVCEPEPTKRVREREMCFFV